KSGTPFKAAKLCEFYHADVIGHHPQQTFSYDDLENHLEWDRRNRTNQTFTITLSLREISSIRFIFTAAEKTQNREAPIEVIYFYRIRAVKSVSFRYSLTSTSITNNGPTTFTKLPAKIIATSI